MHIARKPLLVGLILQAMVAMLASSKLIHPEIGTLKSSINGKNWAKQIKPTLTPIPEEILSRSDGARNPLKKVLEEKKW